MPSVSLAISIVMSARMKEARSFKISTVSINQILTFNDLAACLSATFVNVIDQKVIAAICGEETGRPCQTT